MRIRSVKPAFWPHRMHRRISEPSALLALGLLNWSDDEGRFEADPVQIEKQLFPYRKLSVPIATALAELVSVGWCVLYSGRVDGEVLPLGQVVNFSRHQVINKLRKSALPKPPPGTVPDGSGSATGTVPDGSNPQEGTATGGLLGSMEGRKEGKDRKEDTHIGPSMAEVVEFGRRDGLSEVCCQKFFLENKGRGTLDGLKDWRSALRGWGLSWGIWEQKTAPPLNGHAILPGDDPGWWTQGLDQLENDAMGIGASADPENKKTAGRMMEIARARRAVSEERRSVKRGAAPEGNRL